MNSGTWAKSSHSGGDGACVELQGKPDGGVLVRNSRFPDGAVLDFTDAELAAFLAGAKDGQFDHFTEGYEEKLTSVVPAAAATSTSKPS